MFEDEDLIEVSDELEDHSQKEHHHVNFERAAVTDGGQDVEVVDEGPDEWCDWCNHEYEDGPTWAVAGDLVTGYFCSRGCAELWGCAGDDPERINQTEAVPDGGEDVVTVERKHAETLLEAAGTLRDDIASGRTWGWDDAESRENAGDLEECYRALQDELRPSSEDSGEPITDGGSFEVEQTALDGGQPAGQTTLDGGIDKDGGRRD